MLIEEIEKLEVTPLGFKDTALQPIMSKETVDLHYGVLTKNYVKKYNETKDKFQYAGAILHGIWWAQFLPKNTKPQQHFLELINGDLKTFKEKFEEEALKIHGSGWVYLSKSGEIKTIKNHEIKKDIVLLVDMWEHAYILDYQSDKKKYLSNIWKLINWDVIEDRVSD